MKRSFLIKGMFLLAAVGLICLSLSSNPLAGTAAEQKPINIGFSNDFSGVGAPEGLVNWPVFEMAMKEANAAGGINGRPIKYFALDNAGDPTKVIGNLKVLKELNNCVAVVYGVNSAGAIAGKEWAEKNYISIMATEPISDKLVQKEGKAWLFRSTYTTFEDVAARLMRIKELGYKKVGFVGTTQAMGTDQLDFVKENASKYGLEFVGSVLCEPKSKDLTIQAKRLKDMGPEALISANYVAETGVWGRAVTNIGWQPYTIVFGGPLLAYVLQSFPIELFEGWESTMQINFSKPAVKIYNDKHEAYTKKHYEGEEGVRTYDGVNLLLEAVRLSGNPDDPEAIRDGFYKIRNFPIVSGRPETVGSFEIGRNYTMTSKDMTVVVVKSGKFVLAPRK